MALVLCVGAEAQAREKGELLRQIIEKRSESSAGLSALSTKGLSTKGENYQGRTTNESFENRDLIVYVPSRLPPKGHRAMIVALHGGMGNAVQLQSYLGLDTLADQYGFIVTYLNGTQVMRAGTENMRGWNAGDCCGLPAYKKTDDVAYIKGAVSYLIDKYGVDRTKVFGTGHSNGAMMTERILCETDLYQAAVPYSGTLELDVSSCPAAKGKRILALHGAQDNNLPVQGGYGTEAINKSTNYRSQDSTRKIFTTSGADYQLIILEGATHRPETINEALIKTNGVTLPQTIVKFFGLDQ